MSQKAPDKVVHLVKVGQKILGNGLTKIQWPPLTKKQTDRVQEANAPNVSK